jgi:thioester reductase-like protein
MSLFFFTGFPGFLGSELIQRLLLRRKDVDALCLVQPKFARLARARAAEITTTIGADPARIRIVEGDITAPDLGGQIDADDRREIAEIFHAAAIYDLSVGRALATRVNVNGTRNVLDFAEACSAFQRLHYVSTCYVSGCWPGVFGECDLEVGQEFNNHYEATKYLAEVAVRQRMAAGMPATIYRPAIVVGESTTGATQKYDGPYYVLRWMLRQGRVAVVPVVGDIRHTELNVVPCDFVIDAMDWLSASLCSLGKTYQLADPEPPTVERVLDALARASGKRVIRVRLPLGLAKLAIDRVPGVERLLRIPSAAIDYFVHPTHYDTTNATRDLRGSGIAVPRFEEYADLLVEFMRGRPEIGSAAMA